MKKSYRHTFLQRQLLTLLLLFCSLPLYSQQQQQQELAELQKQIKTTEQQLKQQQQKLANEERQLQQADKALADAAKQVRASEQEAQSLQQRQQQLQEQQQQLNAQLQQQQHLLANQLKSAYTLGRHDYTRLLLNQQDAGKLERLLAYYQYFNRYRQSQLDTLHNTIQELEQVTAALQQQQLQLQQQLTLLQQQQQQLLGAKDQQQQAVSRLQKMLASQGAELDYLRQNEQSLQTTIDQLQKLAQQARELSGLTSQKGRLAWPLRGRLLQRFGESRHGGMPARGIIIQGTEGHNVMAIADGRVIYADWLKGYGWVIVLDHGAGFMSLYGHNQSLLRSPGETIAAGEPVALVGMSGGQSSASLYFEIREKGEAVNPLPWLIKQG